MKEQKSNIEEIFTTFFLSIHIYNFEPLFMFYKLLAICLLGHHNRPFHDNCCPTFIRDICEWENHDVINAFNC
jgi:hypothetical protein